MTTLNDLLDEQPNQPPPRHSRPPRRSAGATISGVLGELLITLGILLGLFVVWQVWWTDVTGMQQAREAISQFEQTLPTIPDKVAEKPDLRTDTPPEEFEPPDAEVFGTLYIPRFGDDYAMPLAQGVGLESVLNDGRVGHYPDTAMPGQVGNFALAGHRQTHGKPFYSIDKLKKGDEIVVQTKQAWYVYSVTDHLVVTPDQVEVIAPVPGKPDAKPKDAVLTLTSCHPIWQISHRYIVHADLEYWMPLDSGYPPALKGAK